MGDVGHDPHQPLRDDVRTLGEVLGRVLRHHEGDELFEHVERVREAAKRSRTELGLSAVAMGEVGAKADASGLSAGALGEAGAKADARDADRLLREMPIASALTVARAFAHFLTLANIAEQHHRVHRRRDHARDPHGHPQRGSCAETFRRLCSAGVSPDTLAAAIRSMRVELVFTAHPTEIVRRTLLQKHNRIAEMLAVRDRPDLTPAEREQALDDLHREIAAAWQTDEVRRARVTPLDEVQYLRAVERALQEVSGTPLAHEVTPIRFGSWMGGDRDGNASVTPEVTRQATWLARWQAADLYLKEIVALRSELSLSSSYASEELRARVGPVSRAPGRGSRPARRHPCARGGGAR